ncbi:MAG: dihydrodipicolinate synthase family protein [Pyrinomonadaceae bacterium]
MKTVEDIIARIRPRRKIKGIAAALLPFRNDGTIAIDAFQSHLRETSEAGLTNAVNMDTGYVNLLTESEQIQVLECTREAIRPGEPFVAGAYIEKLEGDVVSLYRRKVDQIEAMGGIAIIFQSTRLHHLSWREIVSIYQAICKGHHHVLAFELGGMFADSGQIFDDDTVRGLMDIPELVGLKHSSLDRLTELKRLRLRDELRPEFTIYSGNDLGIDMVEYGSDYLLGLATFTPAKFATRDRLWEAGDPSYYSLSSALQHLGEIAFRSPISAYKHSAACFLYVTGKIPSPLPHPNSCTRRVWEIELMRECAERLHLL